MTLEAISNLLVYDTGSPFGMEMPFFPALGPERKHSMCTCVAGQGCSRPWLRSPLFWTTDALGPGNLSSLIWP